MTPAKNFKSRRLSYSGDSNKIQIKTISDRSRISAGESSLDFKVGKRILNVEKTCVLKWALYGKIKLFNTTGFQALGTREILEKRGLSNICTANNSKREKER